MLTVHFNFKQLLVILAIASFSLSFSAVFTKPILAATGINRTINFQGRLVSNVAGSTGLNVSNGSYTVVFSLYNVSSGGTALWTETQTVTTTDGIFRVALGSVTSIPTSFNFNWDGLYLGIQVTSPVSDSEMTPRIQMTAVPFAFDAAQVAGLTVEDSASGAGSTSATLKIGTSGTSPITVDLGTQNLTFTTSATTALTLPTTGTLLTNTVTANQTITSTQVSGNVLSIADTSGTSALAGLSFNLNGSGTTYDLLGTGSTWSITKAGALTVASCSGCGSSSGTNYWNLTNGNGFANQGYITPINSTADLLIGGQSTASAVFAFTGLASSTHQTQATFSGQLTLMPNNGYGGSASVAGSLTMGALGLDALQTVNNQTLTIGGNTTGGITLSPNNGGGTINLNGSLINTSASTLTLFNTTATTINFGGAATTANIVTGATTLAIGSSSVGTLTINNPTIATSVTTGILALFNTGLTGTLNFGGAATTVNMGAPTGSASLSATLVLGGTTSSTIEPGNGTLNFGYKSGANTWGTAMTIRDNTGFVGIGTTAPVATLDVRAMNGTIPVASVSGRTSFAALVANNNGVGDLFTASASGWTMFTVGNTGNITASGTSITANSLTTLTSSATLSMNPNSGSTYTLATTGTTLNLFNTTALTLNFAGAATTANLTTAATTLAIGSSSVGTLTINNPTIATSVTSSTLALFNTGLTGTLNFAGLASTVSIGANQLLLGASASTSGNIKFQVIGSSSSTASAQIWNAFPDTGNAACTNSTCHTVLSLKLGDNNKFIPGSADRFINFATGNGTIIGKIQGNGTNASMSSTGGDYAEYFQKANPNDQFNYGDLVCLNTNGKVVKCDNNNQNLLGVVSGSYFLLGNDNDSYESNPNYVIVGLLGQLKTTINSQNGAINPGDYLTYSSTSGVATKATKAGPVIGMAVDGGTGGEIEVYVNPTWYDPQVYLTSSGNLNLVDQTASNTNYTIPHYFTLNDALGNPLQRVGEFSDAAIANLRVGLVNAQQITTNALSVASENITINGQNIRDYITSIVTSAISNSQFALSNGQAIISPLATVNTLQTSLIVPIDDNANVALKLSSNQLSVLNSNSASGLAVATIDNQGNASFSGQLTSNSLNTGDATISGTLHVEKLIADEIVGGLEIPTNQTLPFNDNTAVLADATGSADLATGSAQLPTTLNLSSLNVDGLATISADLNVRGNTLVQGVLNVLNNITTQNLLVSQFAYFIQDVVFKGNVRFDSTPTFNNDTAGFAVIQQGLDSVQVNFSQEYVNTPVVTASIALDKTGDSSTQQTLEDEILNGNISYVITQRTTQGFIIKLNKPAPENISFSWVALSVENAQTSGLNLDVTPIPTATDSAAFQSILNQLNLTPTPTQ